MAVGFASYEIARSGMFVNERGLFVTGHNISNVNTPGYVRQQAMITTGPYNNIINRNGIFQLGLGADIQQIRQIRHSFLDNLYRQENTTLGYWETRNKTFQDIQAIMGEPMGAGLQTVLNQFWDSWQELSKEPESLTVRAMVRQRGEALVHHINHMGTQIDKLQKDLDSEIRVRIDEVNQITSQISHLNSEILKAEVTGDLANDYRDQRNLLVDRLSKLVSADVTEMQDGQLSVTIGGYFVVHKDKSTELFAGQTTESGLFCVPVLAGTNIEIPMNSGIIKGLLESRGEVFGAKGSYSNGTPNTKADITIVIDNSDGSADNLDNIKHSILKYADDLKRRGIDFNLRLVTYSDNVQTNTTVWNRMNIDNAGSSFTEAVEAITVNAVEDNNFQQVVDNLNSIGYRKDAWKHAIVFTGESIGGDEVNIDEATLLGYISSLSDSGIKTSVVTDSSHFHEGEPEAGPGETPAGWSSITGATGGRLYDMNSSDFNGLMASIIDDINADINRHISVVEHSNNIISRLRTQLNALINIMVREINYHHSGAMTLDGKKANDFFVAINDAYPLEMGNIKLNENLMNLNNIAASLSGNSGDNTNALKIANLRHSRVMTDTSGIMSIDGYYQAIILNIGHYGQEAARIGENQQKLVNSADSYRQSITNVSMDEEMSNMMKYKFAYNASSRAINVIDEMIETVVVRMGLVGR